MEALINEEVMVRGRRYVVRNYVPSDMRGVLDLARDLYEKEISPLTGMHVNEELIATMERSAHLVGDVLVVVCDSLVCGFLRYAVWRNRFSGELVTENISMYICPEHRSKALFSLLVSCLESVAFYNGSDVMAISFETAEKKYVKKRMMEGMGFEVGGVFLYKNIKNKDQRIAGSLSTSPVILPSVPRLFEAILFVRRNLSKSGWWPFVRWMFSEVCATFRFRYCNSSAVFISEKNGGFIFAKTFVRNYDMQKVSLVTLLGFPSASLVSKLEEWSLQNGCSEMRINTAFFNIDPRLIFPDYEEFGYCVLGFVMKKSCSVVRVY